jgi:hypothetical protein
VHNKSLNRLQPKRAEDLVYVYTNFGLMVEGKEKDKKFMVIWIWMVGMMEILGPKIQMGKRIVAPLLQEETVYKIQKLDILSMTIEMTT